ncbi:hypothetical protein SETIT_1G268500v2 [Setaria italica]|uniref:Uncharacterized protein n=2 Tax=Setaria TaxID=4554 RepID=A0A368PPZ3_SETIT|nr:hypothetical protein SETIT_1G268500v2 [Setaria italica]TKW40843.1 hypothetical protein SEVIR_1G273100v2 [Setaria viridis]
MLSRRCKKLGCSILLSRESTGVQDIIDLKKGYLRHAACDGTEF